VLTAFEDDILWQGITLISSSVSLSYLCVHFRYKTLLYRNLNQNYNILYLEHLIYDLYVYTCVFLLHQESFDMILVNIRHFIDELLHWGLLHIFYNLPRLPIPDYRLW
jgi:hypothetical protein